MNRRHDSCNVLPPLALRGASLITQ